jgi:hypothetical protein
MEAQYQDEFYRVCCDEFGLCLISEWTGMTLGGRVDFQIKSAKWAIECVRDGDRLAEHIARFCPGDKYYKWITDREIQQYIILDFRKTMPQTVRDNVPFLYHIVFSDNYTRCDIYDAKLVQVMKQMALLHR